MPGSNIAQCGIEEHGTMRKTGHIARIG